MSTVSKSVSNEPVLVREDGDAVCTLTLNRPADYNALSDALLDELLAAFESLGDDSSIRVVVIAARGRAFCAGHDLKEMRANPDRGYYEKLFKKCGRMMMSMIRLPQPVIARVHGIATAAGCQLVANSDLAVASTESRFGTSGINVGLFCMTPGVALARNLNRKHSFEMLFTGDIVSAERAKQVGLVNKVVPTSGLDAAIAEYTEAIIDKSQVVVAAGKRTFYSQIEMGLEAAYDYAAEEMALNMTFHDAGEGIDAFIAKRTPVWRHE